MIKFEQHSPDSIDVEELAAFTHRAYSKLPIPYKYGESQEEIAAFLRANTCAGVWHWTDSMAYFLSWHPLVIPQDPEIAQRLVRECIQYTYDSGRNRMEVFLMNLTNEYRAYAARCGEVYQAAGMSYGFEWLFMEADLKALDFTLRTIPETMQLRSLTEVPNDALWLVAYQKSFDT